jgi:NodT family efflux transporter outer membrane factor (OMF) lipoprotein
MGSALDLGALGRILVGAATAAVLAGCALQGASPLPLSTSLSESTATFSDAQGDWPTDSWWTSYGDDQLDGLVAEGISHAPTLAAALARVRSAEAVAGQAGAARAPQVSANASVNDQKQSYNNGIPPLFVPKGYNTGGRTTLDLSYDFDLWGKNIALLRAARLEADASRVDAAAAQLTLSTAIVSAYADLSRAYLDRDAAVRTLDIRAETAALVRQRLGAGLDARGAARQTDAIQKSAQADVLAVDEVINLDRDRIAALLGAGPDRGARIVRPGPLRPFKAEAPKSLALDLLARRPDIAAARLHALAAAERVKAAHTDFYPNFSLSAFAGAQSLKLSDLYGKGSDIGSLSPAVHLPIFTGGRVAAAYRGSKADFDGAVANYDQSVVAGLQDVADTLVSRRTLGARIEQTRASVKGSEEAWQLAKIRYEAGISPLVTLLSAEDQFVSGRRALIALEGRAVTLDVSLIRALGGGFRDDTSQISEGP